MYTATEIKPIQSFLLTLRKTHCRHFAFKNHKGGSLMKTFLSRFVICVLAVAIMLLGSAYAGNGKITGRVTDAENNNAVPGANVRVTGTQLGASADANGDYFILNVPPGTYELVGSAVGYARLVVRNVQVGSDQIVSLNFALRPEAVGLEEVVIQAETRVVDQSQTSSRTRLSSSDFTALPLRSAYELVSTAPSVYRGFVRGGKQFETKTLVEGIDVTDQFFAFNADGAGNQPYLVYNGVVRQQESQTASLVSLNLSSVEEANVLTGGVGADYSSASAGIISYSLREGRGPISGRLNLRSSNIFSHGGGLQHFGPNVYNDAARYIAEYKANAASTVQANKDKATRYTWFPEKYNYGRGITTDDELALGGDIFENTGFYFTGGYYQTRGRMPNEFTRRINSSLKLTYSPSSSTKWTAVGLLQDQGKLFGWKNSNFMDDFRYFLEGVPRWNAINFTGSVKLTQVLSPTTFYEVQVAGVVDQTTRGYVDGNNNGKIELDESGDFLTFADTAQVNRYMATAGNTDFTKFFSPTPRNETGSETQGWVIAWKIARPGIYYEDLINNTLTVKGDIVSQVTSNHQLRGGVQWRFHNLSRELRAGFIGGVFPAYKNYSEEIWTLQPKEYSAYIQDKMEYAGLIINLGTRLEVFDLAANDYANYFAPFTTVTEFNTSTGAGGGPVRVPIRGPRIAKKVYLSPRLGVSHPISDNASMYFSFSRQTQLLPFSSIYVDYNDFGNPSLPNIVPVDQDPIRSTNYDLGVQWSFARGYGLDVNAYFKDILNYSKIGFAITPNAPYRNYNLTTSFGYADSRGVEVTLRKNLEPVIAEWLSIGGRASYAYSYIKQSEFTGGNQTTFSTVAGDSARLGGQLPFADLRNYNTIERNVRGGFSSLTGGYDRPHRITYTLFFKFPEEITFSSVGRFESGFYYLETLGDPRARSLATGPWNKRIDMRVEKMFMVGKQRFSAYIERLNVFSWKNILAYNNRTTADQIEWEKNQNPTGVIKDGAGNYTNRPITQDGSMIYDIPGEWYFGISYQF
jgi:hypothetical protein